MLIESFKEVEIRGLNNNTEFLVMLEGMKHFLYLKLAFYSKEVNVGGRKYVMIEFSKALEFVQIEGDEHD